MKHLKILFTIIGCILVIISGFYFYINSVIFIDEYEFSIYLDKKEGKTVLLEPGYNFVLRGMIPGRVTYYNFKKRNVNLFGLTIKSPLLRKMDNDSYNLGVDISLTYEIDADLIIKTLNNQLKNGNNAVKRTIKKYLIKTLNNELLGYLHPAYKKQEIVRNKDKIIYNTLKKLKKHCSRIGVSIIDYSVIGGFRLPAVNIFNEGIRYSKELREKEKNNKEKMITLNGTIERERDQDKIYFERLEKMSNLISRNPDILKYMYIEKMADNVKVIIAPDESGIPFGLGKKELFPESIKQGEIDNLR